MNNLSKFSGSRPFGGNSVSADSLSSVEGFWRALDTSEALFAAFKKQEHLTAQALEVHGPVTETLLLQALALVENRHPMLRARIIPRGDSLYWAEGPATPSPISVVDRVPAGGLEALTIGSVTTPEPMLDEIDALKAALAAERAARQQAEARASGAEAMVAHLKLLIAGMKREQYGQSSERGRHLLDQLELQLEELEASAAEGEAIAMPADTTSVISFTRQKPVRAPLPAHLPRERVVIAGPSACPCCGGKLAKLGEDIDNYPGDKAKRL